MKTSSADYEFVLDNRYFEDIDGPEVRKGDVTAQVSVKRLTLSFELNISIDGTVIVPCDRCLDDMDVEVKSADKLIVKFGREYAEEGDNLIIIPEDEGAINVAWFIYELIALAVPMKHVHAPGKCNKAMTSKLSKHLRVDADDEDLDEDFDFEDVDDLSEDGESAPIDPRWNELKKILDNN